MQHLSNRQLFHLSLLNRMRNTVIQQEVTRLFPFLSFYLPTFDAFTEEEYERFEESRKKESVYYRGVQY